MAHVIEILFVNRERVMALAESGVKAAYEQLADIPDIAAIPFNTFKVHFPGFIVLMGLIQAEQSARKEVIEMPAETIEAPKNFNGWTIQTGKDGFIRLYKSFQGRVKSLYIGKAWDEQKALSKIAGVTK